MANVSPADTPGNTAPYAFSANARAALYDIIAARRDIRNFRPDPVADDVLHRILSAAHQAASVGFMQPWDFIVVRSPEKKAAIYDLFREANEQAATRHAGDRALAYAALKLQGLLDAPLGLCVTCDRRRGGPHVLGRDSIPEMDLYSTCLAVQNLWLAARAEGVGIGWVSIVDNAKLAQELRLPDGVVPVAYLCVGYPVEFPDNPMLETVGWRERIPVESVIHLDTWTSEHGVHPSSVEGEIPALVVNHEWLQQVREAPAASNDWLRTVVHGIATVDHAQRWKSRTLNRLDELTIPTGSLGLLSDAVVRLARIQQTEYPTVAKKVLLVFAGDHGVTEEDVSAYRADVTARLCYNFMAGGGAANALMRSAGGALRIIDVGVDHDFGTAQGIRHAKIRRGTRNMTREPACTADEVLRAMQAGAQAVDECDHADIIALGEVGIGNTTTAAALLATLINIDAESATGFGTGIGANTRTRKTTAINRALTRHADAIHTPLDALAAVGGLEIAALVGAILEAAARGRPVLLDGFITGVAALAAVRIAEQILPEADLRDYLIASHQSAEQAHACVLDELGLKPLLALDLRVGEGSGAALAMPLLDAACRVMRDVRTFREAGIETPLAPGGRE